MISFLYVYVFIHHPFSEQDKGALYYVWKTLAEGHTSRPLLGIVLCSIQIGPHTRVQESDARPPMSAPGCQIMRTANSEMPELEARTRVLTMGRREYPDRKFLPSQPALRGVEFSSKLVELSRLVSMRSLNYLRPYVSRVIASPTFSASWERGRTCACSYAVICGRRQGREKRFPCGRTVAERRAAAMISQVQRYAPAQRIG